MVNYFWIKVIIGFFLALCIMFIAMMFRVSTKSLLVIFPLAVISVILISSSIAQLFMNNTN